MKDSLTVIDSQLERLNRKTLIRLFGAGIGGYDVRDSVSKLGLESIPELETLYAWHNGVSQNSCAMLDDIQVFPGFYMLSIDDAIATYRTLERVTRWNRGWFPMFADGGGGFYVVNLASEKRGNVRLFWNEESDSPIEFNSLPEMMDTVAQGFIRGVFYVDQRGYLEMKDEVFRKLAEELNPGVVSWRGR